MMAVARRAEAKLSEIDEQIARAAQAEAATQELRAHALEEAAEEAQRVDEEDRNVIEARRALHDERMARRESALEAMAKVRVGRAHAMEEARLGYEGAEGESEGGSGSGSRILSCAAGRARHDSQASSSDHSRTRPPMVHYQSRAALEAAQRAAGRAAQYRAAQRQGEAAVPNRRQSPLVQPRSELLVHKSPRAPPSTPGRLPAPTMETHITVDLRDLIANAPLEQMALSPAPAAFDPTVPDRSDAPLSVGRNRSPHVMPTMALPARVPTPTPSGGCKASIEPTAAAKAAVAVPGGAAARRAMSPLTMAMAGIPMEDSEEEGRDGLFELPRAHEESSAPALPTSSEGDSAYVADSSTVAAHAPSSFLRERPLVWMALGEAMKEVLKNTGGGE